MSSFATLIGTEIIFGSNLLDGYVPLALQEPDPFKMFNKHKEMIVLNDKPWNIEAQAHLLDDKVTPNSCMFIRNNGLVPEEIDEKNWVLKIDGESVVKEKTCSLADLKSKFEHYTYQLTIECGGNGRSEFNPPAKGNQWTIGAVHCASWTGVRLRDVLVDAGIKDNAVYILVEGEEEARRYDTVITSYDISVNPDLIIDLDELEAKIFNSLTAHTVTTTLYEMDRSDTSETPLKW